MIVSQRRQTRRASAWSGRFLAILAGASGVCASAAEIDIAGPPGSGAFGSTVAILPNGNIVVTDPEASTDTAAHVGAIYLYSPAGTLISTLRGSSANDSVGDGPLFVLADGNVVALSPRWNNGDAAGAGAATWINGTTGLDGIVGADNSLVGSSTDDAVGFDVTVLAGGGCVITTPGWNNGDVAEAGAATFVPAGGGVHGAVSAANSLIGAHPNDRVGERIVTLANGNYLVMSPHWTNGELHEAGAVTWASGSAGVAGAGAAQNSLVGDTRGDNIGSAFAHPFANGNALIGSPGWDSADESDAGAITWIDGSHGLTGPVSAANSLVGSSFGDRIGSSGWQEPITELAGGGYAILSNGWSDADGVAVGAVTWVASTAAPVTGTITPANSLVGSSDADLGTARVIALTNGNAVVSARDWTNGDVPGAGAVTWIDGAHPPTGPITTANSLVGTTQFEQVGYWVEPLTNGNYVVTTPAWNGAAGAVTWVDGSAPRTGTVTAANSLVGSDPGDEVGLGADSSGVGAVVPLGNGNYVVLSANWSSDTAPHVGAATWGNGATGTTGTVGADNSLIGDEANDGLDLAAIPLANGNAVISNPYWHFATGAVTWMDGTAGIAGTISAQNSLVGRTSGDAVNSVVPLASSRYFVFGYRWNYGASIDEAGAVVWGDGRTALVGEVSPANALVGTHASEWLGFNVKAVGNERVVITSQYSVTLARSSAPLVGPPTAENSVLAQQPGLGIPAYAYDAARDRLVVGWYNANYVAIFQTEVLLQNGFD